MRWASLRLVASFFIVSCFVGHSASQLPSNLRPSSRFEAFTYEAERAQIRQGKIAVKRHPNASGGAFVEAESEAILHFLVNAPQPMSVRVIPIFWRNSLREQPRFFPYPLPTLFGPDAVVALGNRFYFTAPASGQIGVVDAASGQIVGSVKLGGYLTDLVADEKRQRLLVADAWNGRIVVIDAKTLKRYCRNESSASLVTGIDARRQTRCRQPFGTAVARLGRRNDEAAAKNRFASATDANFCDDGEGRSGVSHELHFGCCRF